MIGQPKLLAAARRRNSGVDLAANLMLRWRMDEATGNVLADSHTGAGTSDGTAVGNIYDGGGGPTASPVRTAGVYGNGVQCGTAGNGQYVRNNSGSQSSGWAFELDNGAEMTVGVWVKMYARGPADKWNVLLHAGRGDAFRSGCKVEILAWTDGLCLIHIWGFSQWTTFTLPLNVWTHVMFSRVRATRVVKLYFNGVLNTTYTMPAIAQDGFATFAAGNSISGLASGYTSRFDGALDDFRVYNRVLTDAEIASIYAGTDKQTP